MFNMVSFLYGSYVKGEITLIVKESVNITFERNEKTMDYYYRLTEENYGKGQAFGIEIERQDIKDGKVINIERDSVNMISNNEERVKNIFNLLYKNNVSPIHLLDVIGEYVDEYVGDFN